MPHQPPYNPSITQIYIPSIWASNVSNLQYKPNFLDCNHELPCRS